jgi:DNA-binding NarL/FixJ family response regulator
LIANPTRSLRDALYGAIRKQPDMEVAGEVSDACTILAAVEMTDPDCLVIALDQSGVSMPFCKQLLRRNTRARILAISEAVGVAALCWWYQGDIRCTYMEASHENLMEALRCRLY